MVSSNVATIAAIVGLLAIAIGAWRDIRHQKIAGSLPTEFTTNLVNRVNALEARLDAKDKEGEEKDRAHESYRRASRTWFYAATAAAAKGEPLPVPPPDWP